LDYYYYFGNNNYWNNYLLEYISWNKKSQFWNKGFHVKRKREAAEREKGQKAEQEKRKSLKLQNLPD